MERLFLDTARMGQPTNDAINATLGLSQYWSKYGLSADFDQFLREGFDDTSVKQFPALASWRGVQELKDRLRECAGLSRAWKVLLANRSSKLFEVPLALIQRKRLQVMCFRSLWPRYQKLLSEQADIVVFNDLRTPNHSTLISESLDFYHSTGCRAIVLPTVTHLGTVFPYSELLEQITAYNFPELIVLDGAQEFGHLPIRSMGEVPIVYVSCTQKWIRSGHTAGVAFISPQVSWPEVCAAVNQTDDPLLQFVCGASSEECFGETVQVSSLVACRAAIEGLAPEQISSRHNLRTLNRRNLEVVLMLSGGPESMRSTSGILTISLGQREPSQSSSVRRAFLDLGVVVSAFPGSLVRLSMPDYKLSESQLLLIEDCFNRYAGTEIHFLRSDSYGRAYKPRLCQSVNAR